MNQEQLIALAIQEAPNAIALLQAAFTKANPGVPPPTDEDVARAWLSAYQSSLDKDNAWLAAHPG